MNAAELFHLDEYARESLANKAGLSFVYGQPQTFKSVFTIYLETLLPPNRGSNLLAGTISERMMEYIQNGMTPTKESTLALGILFGLDEKGLRKLLGCAGYALSKSLPNDMVVEWMFNNRSKSCNDIHLLLSINELLDEFGYPLLMTRNKNEKS